MFQIGKWLAVLLLTSGGALAAAEAAAEYQRDQPGKPPGYGTAPAVDVASRPVLDSAPSDPGGLPLRPRGVAASDKTSRPATSGRGSFWTMFGGLSAVIGLVIASAWLMRRVQPAGSQRLPQEVLELLGRAPLAGRHQLHLVRCGRKLLLLSVTATGAETLTEITDPDEADRLADLCRKPASSAGIGLRQIFQPLQRPPVSTSGGAQPRESAHA